MAPPLKYPLALSRRKLFRSALIPDCSSIQSRTDQLTCSFTNPLILMSTQQRRRPPLFEYPALPKNEIRVYCLVTAAAIFYGWYCVYNASTKWTFKVGHLASVTDLPLFGRRFKVGVSIEGVIDCRFQDQIDWEWSRWSPTALSIIPHMVLNSLVFNFGEKILPNSLWILVYIGVSMWSTAMIYTLRLLLYSLAQGVFIFVCTHFYRSTLVVWISALPILYLVMNHTTLLSDDPFLVLLFVSYNLLSYISFNLERVKGNCRAEDKTFLDLLIRMLFYSFYQPYLISLIVLYPDFERQLGERVGRKRDWSRIVKFTLRIGFWWMFVELMLHFFYFGSILHDVSFSARLPKNELVTLGMALCEFKLLICISCFRQFLPFQIRRYLRTPVNLCSIRQHATKGWAHLSCPSCSDFKDLARL
jgi:hypothetical protein